LYFFFRKISFRPDQDIERCRRREPRDDRDADERLGERVCAFILPGAQPPPVTSTLSLTAPSCRTTSTRPR
jgi:hypothetical protein